MSVLLQTDSWTNRLLENTDGRSDQQTNTYRPLDSYRQIGRQAGRQTHSLTDNYQGLCRQFTLVQCLNHIAVDIPGGESFPTAQLNSDSKLSAQQRNK